MGHFQVTRYLVYLGAKYYSCLGNGRVMQIYNPGACNPGVKTIKIIQYTESSKNDDSVEKDYKDYMLSVFNKSSRR